MRTIVLYLLFLLTTASATETFFKACDVNKERAKAALAQQIYIEISTSFSSTKEHSSNLLSFDFNEVKKSIHSKSRLTLSNIQYTFDKTTQQQCASIAKADLLTIAKGKLNEIQNYSLAALPKEEIDAIYYIEERLDEIKQTKAISKLFPESFTADETKLLEKQYTLFYNERANRHMQSISFLLAQKETTLFIDGEKQTRLQKIYLTQGEHSYTITKEGFHPYKARFTLNENEHKIITLDIASNAYPVLHVDTSIPTTITLNDQTYKSNTAITLKPGTHTFVVNPAKGLCSVQQEVTLELGETKHVKVAQEMFAPPALIVYSNQKNARLTIDGKYAKLGSKQIFKGKCEAHTVGVSVEFEGSVENQTIELQQAETRTVHMNFLTNADRRVLRTLANAYKTKTRLEFRALAQNYTNHTPVGFGFGYIRHSAWLRHGIIVNTLTDGSQEVNSAEYLIAFGLNEYGNRHLPLHYNSYAFFPYIGVKAGYALIDFDENGLEWKVEMGSDIALNSSLSLTLFIEQEVSRIYESGIGFSISFTNPFGR